MSHILMIQSFSLTSASGRPAD